MTRHGIGWGGAIILCYYHNMILSSYENHFIILSYHYIIISSYHQIIIETFFRKHFPENRTRHFSKNFDKRPGESSFHKGFRYKSRDDWLNSPKSGVSHFSPTICRSQKKTKHRSARRDENRPRIVKIGVILAIFEPLKILKNHMQLFREFRRSSRDLYRNPLRTELSPGRLPKFFEKWRVAF